MTDLVRNGAAFMLILALEHILRKGFLKRMTESIVNVSPHRSVVVVFKLPQALAMISIVTAMLP